MAAQQKTRERIEAEARGERLATARRLLSVALGRDLSQAEIARMIDVSQNSWNEWERGLVRPGAENFFRLTDLFVRHGMPYITKAWIDHGAPSAGFPIIVTGPIEPVAPLPAVEMTPVESPTTEKSAGLSQPKKSAGRRR